MYVGRGINATTCYEGALKLKEISYLHAEAYAAGELKHGPIALLDPSVPVVAVVTESPTRMQTSLPPCLFRFWAMVKDCAL